MSLEEKVMQNLKLIILTLTLVLTSSCKDKVPVQEKVKVPAAAKASQTKTTRHLDSTIAAEVNGEQIPMAKLDELSSRRTSLAKLPKERTRKIRLNILNKVISDLLVTQDLRTRKITIDPAEVEKSLLKKKEQSGGQLAYEKGLKGSFTTEAEYKNSIDRTLKLTKFLNESDPIEITDQDVERHFLARNKGKMKPTREIKISEILIRVAPDAADRERNKAKRLIVKLRARIVAGEPFEEVAKTHSQAASKHADGKLDFKPESKLPRDIASAIGLLMLGELSDPIITEQGWFLIRVDARRNAASTSDEKKAESRRILETAARQRRSSNYLAKLRAEADILISDQLKK
jgi:parvulin-like peptidyl-prolyl isomerase